MSKRQSQLEEIIRSDPRDAQDAYEFLFRSLKRVEKTAGRLPAEAGSPRHVSGRQLLEGVRELALRDYGMMARSVFHAWGVRRTDDFGDMVFNLVEAGLMSKTDDDRREDFHEVFDLNDDWLSQSAIKLEEVP